MGNTFRVMPHNKIRPEGRSSENPTLSNSRIDGVDMACDGFAPSASPASAASAVSPGTSPSLEDFLANPRLTMRKVVNNMNRRDFGTAVQPGYSPESFAAVMREALDGADAGAPVTGRSQRARLRGGITPNRTSRPTSSNIDATPTGTEMAWLLAGERLAHDILEFGVPDSLAEQADVFAVLSEPVKAGFGRYVPDSRGIAVMEAAARHLIHHARPAHLTHVPLRRLNIWRAEQVAHLADLHAEVPGDHHPDLHAQQDLDAVQRLLERPRILWAHPEGIGRGLLIDRMHHTSLKGLLGRDTWVRRKVTEDLHSVGTLLRQYAPDTDWKAGLLGVRVISHRRPNESVHFAATTHNGVIAVGHAHPVGTCRVCKLGNGLPNQTADASNGLEVLTKAVQR